MSVSDEFLDAWIDLEEVLSWLPSEPFFVDERRVVEVREALATAGFVVVDISLSNIRDEHQLLTSIGRALSFPPHYGENWDSMHDILRERGERLPWHISILFSSCDSLASADFHGFVRSVSTLQAMAADLSSIVQRPYGQLELFYLADWSAFPPRS